MFNRILSALLAIILLLLAGGCAVKTDKSQKIRDLEFTVVRDEEIPEELKAQIEEKKEARFKITYQDGEYLYIASGYGQQETGGYCIEMKELYLAENAIYFATELYGPQKGETIHRAPSYPYIVIKTEALEEPVVFQ